MNWNIFKRLATLEQENKSLADDVATLYNRCLSLETRLVNTQGRFGPVEHQSGRTILAVEELEKTMGRRFETVTNRVNGLSYEVKNLAETATDLGLEDSRLDNILQAHAERLKSHSAKFSQMAVASKPVTEYSANAPTEALALVKKLKHRENSRRHYEKSKKIKAAIAAEAAK
jgi:hypothetical protein